jgi:S1-C subfamily serine protease
VAADPAAAAEMVHRSGQRGVPVIVVDDQVVVGFDRPRLDQLLATRRVSRPRLGLSVADAKQMAAKEGNASVRGAYVGHVKPSSPGERAGLLKGDVIVELAGRPVANAGDLETVISTLTVGQPVAVVFLRGGQRMQAQMTP